MAESSINNGAFEGDQSADSVWQNFNQAKTDFNTLNDIKANLDDIIQASNGTIRVNTLVDLLALTGETDKTYAVTRDGLEQGELGVDNNGYYSYSGTEFLLDRRLLELELSTSTNLAKDDYIVYDKFVASNGQIFDGEGWVMYKIPIEPLGTYTFGNFLMDSVGYSAFYNENDTLNQYTGSHTNGDLPKTVTSTSPNARFLYIVVARPTNEVSDWAQTTVNLGASLLPYEEPVDYVDGISGYDLRPTGIAQGEDLDVATLSALAFKVDIEEAATEPAGLASGYAWIDTNDRTIKVKS